MSIGNEDLSQILQPGETNPRSIRQSKVSYSRKFLLSLSNLEICKRLPDNEPLLSELGSSPLQGFRRNDYSSSPPEKGETGSFSRGVDRWDSRASGRSDTDSHSDRDSDSGRRYGTQFRRPWQNPDHDGLLGSGSLPRPPGFRPGAPLPNSRANNQPHLKKSSDPYHPPRPFKAAPHSHRETKDSYNDETFGWGENTSEGRSEEEIKRRAEFEMMRKEQHKELQQKMKSKAEKLKDDPMTELAASNGGEDVITNELHTSVVNIIQQNDSGKSFVSSQDHQIRPLVPPGFANAAAVEKFSGPKTLEPLEVGKLELGHENKDEKPTSIGLGYNNCEITSSFATKGGINSLVPSLLELSSKTTDSDDHSFRAPNISETSDVLQSGNMSMGSENLNELNVIGEAGHSTSILEKLFGGALSLSSNSLPTTIEDQNMKSDDGWSPKHSQLQTSKFVHLFPEEENKLPESGTLEKSNDLLSLIGGERSRLLASEPAEKTLTPLSHLMKLTTSMPNDVGISEVVCNNKQKAEIVPAFLTCEDLEQSILSNVGESSSSSARPPQICTAEHGTDKEIKKADIDKNASHHLLSLLQTGTSVNSNSMPRISMLDKEFPSEPNILDSVRDEGAENMDCGKGLTLETLFGTAFMKELKSGDAPAAPLQWNSSLASSCMDVSEPSMPLPVPPLVVSDDTCDARFKREDYISLLGGRHETNHEEDRSSVQRQLLDPIMNHGRPMFHHLDSHRAVSYDPQFSVMPQAQAQAHGGGIRHQFPANVGSYRHHPGSGLPEFDHLIHPMLQQQQQQHMGPNNNFLPPPHPTSANLPPAYIQDHNLIHSFPFGPHHPNHGMRLGGAAQGDTSNQQPPPQALQRILEMELRSSQNPMHHPGTGHSRPVYGHDLDAPLWYT